MRAREDPQTLRLLLFLSPAVALPSRNHFLILLEAEATGRLLRYDPPTGTTHVLLTGLAFANGVQLSDDQTFLLFAETTNCRQAKRSLTCHLLPLLPRENPKKLET